MAIQLITSSPDINAAYTRLLYTVSGSVYTDQPQFQYVCDVKASGSNEIIKRMTQPINPGGTATFDVARIVQGELSVDYNWDINTDTRFDKSFNEFFIEIGEQFGTSISSSVTVYPDQVDASVLAFQAVVDPNGGYSGFGGNNAGYNWSSKNTSGSGFEPGQVLSNMPSTMSMQSDDIGTISVYTPGINPTIVSQSFYSASSTTGTYVLVDQKNYSIQLTTPYGSSKMFCAVPISSSANYWNYVDVAFGSGSFGAGNAVSYRYEASDETHREKTRFAFVNKLGAWDYYNNYNPVRQRIEVSREQYTAARVDYSSRLSTYDISRRGRNDYHNSTDDQFTVDTDLLDKENANWLEELIESPEVYIQRNGEFIPIVITDTSYTSNTNQARQKQFKYTINFKPSNQPFGTWIPEYVSCPKQIVTLPSVTTYNASAITGLGFTASGSVTSDTTVTERGFVYSSASATPVIDSDINNIKVIQGSGTGEFNKLVNDTLPNTTYSIRAYAINSAGTGYGNIVSASTINGPNVVTDFFSAATTSSMVLHGDIVSTEGQAPFHARGFVYSTSSTQPVYGVDTYTEDPSGGDPWDVQYSVGTGPVLNSGQSVYFRALVSGSDGKRFYGYTLIGTTL